MLNKLNRLNKRRGFTLVELMIVVVIIGILAALAIMGIAKYVRAAKTTEAKSQIDKIVKLGDVAYFKEVQQQPGVVDGYVALANELCQSIAKTPTTTPSGEKYQAVEADWLDWTCLGFEINGPTYYSYTYNAPTDDTYEAIAEGDLDGDGTDSKFWRTAQVDGNNGRIKKSATIEELNPEE